MGLSHLSIPRLQLLLCGLRRLLSMIRIIKDQVLFRCRQLLLLLLILPQVDILQLATTLCVMRVVLSSFIDLAQLLLVSAALLQEVYLWHVVVM
jgi:hypothetical protein